MYKKLVLRVCNQVVTPHEYFHSSVTEVCLLQLYNAVPQVLRQCNGGWRGTLHWIRMSELIMQWFMFKSQTAEISSDSLLHVGICCKLLASLVLVWVQTWRVTGYEISWYITSQPKHHKQSQVWLAVWGALISISVDYLWSIMSTGSKLSPAGYRHDTDFCLCWDTSLGVTVVQVLDYVYRLLPLCHVYALKSEQNYLLPESLPYILKLFFIQKTGCSLTEFCSYSRPWKANVTFCLV